MSLTRLRLSVHFTRECIIKLDWFTLTLNDPPQCEMFNTVWSVQRLYPIMLTCYVRWQLFLMNLVTFEYTTARVWNCHVTWHRLRLPTSRGFIERSQHHGVSGKSILMVRYLRDCETVSALTTPPRVTTVWQYWTFTLLMPDVIDVLINNRSYRTTSFTSVVSNDLGYIFCQN